MLLTLLGCVHDRIACEVGGPTELIKYSLTLTKLLDEGCSPEPTRHTSVPSATQLFFFATEIRGGTKIGSKVVRNLTFVTVLLDFFVSHILMLPSSDEEKSCFLPLNSINLMSVIFPSWLMNSLNSVPRRRLNIRMLPSAQPAIQLLVSENAPL